MNQINEVLNSIDMVDDVTLEYSFNIVDSMFKAYEKSAIILENYEGDDLSSFTIFQEGEIMDDVKKQGQGQGTLMKILSFIPRLIKAIFHKLSRNNKKNGNIKDINQNLQKAPKEVKKALPILFDNKKDKKSKVSMIKKILIGAGTVGAVAAAAVVGKNAMSKSKKNKKDEPTSSVQQTSVQKTQPKTKEQVEKDYAAAISKIINDYTKKNDEIKKIYNDIIDSWEDVADSQSSILSVKRSDWEIANKGSKNFIIIQEKDEDIFINIRSIANPFSIADELSNYVKYLCELITTDPNVFGGRSTPTNHIKLVNHEEAMLDKIKSYVTTINAMDDKYIIYYDRYVSEYDDDKLNTAYKALSGDISEFQTKAVNYKNEGDKLNEREKIAQESTRNANINGVIRQIHLIEKIFKVIDNMFVLHHSILKIIDTAVKDINDIIEKYSKILSDLENNEKKESSDDIKKEM